MSFRIEEKISFIDFNVFEFKKWLFSKQAKILYPSRIINSIYFDNKLKMFDESIEGTVPRKKIRVRTYETKNFFKTLNPYKKETKLTYYNYRDKIVENFSISPNKIFKGIYDSTYGICKPNLNVFYKRSYFNVFDTRFTLDEEINYRLVKNNNISNFSIKDKNFVIEIKSNKINNTDFLKEIFPLARTRFSKYCRGIELHDL